MKKELIEIIKNLEEQLKDIKKENMDDASWAYEEGILLSGREAKKIVVVLKQKVV